MSFRIGGFRTAGFVGAMMLVGSVAGSAQTMYPSFQQPRIASREFNFAIGDGEIEFGNADINVTPFVFQWREGTTAGTQISFDAGLADPEEGLEDPFMILGGQYARSLARARADMPLDVLLTVGAFTQFGNDIMFLTVPVGVSVGHRFPIEGTAMSITPYVHPRLALEYTSFEFAGEDESDTDMGISFDVGGNLEFSPQLALRLSASFGDADVIGLSLAWSPRGLRTAAPTRAPR
jgi:hypothetical protein